MGRLRSWALRQKDIYVGNATSVRDMRSELRGNRPIVLWGIYLTVLIAFALIAFNSMTAYGSQSAARSQSSLIMFYNSLMLIVGILIALVSPSLTASSIVIERERQSLDLVFCAPVSIKYLLVGKLLATFRYTWMLLALALPIASMGVVMGGATWQEVLKTFAVVSANGVLFASMGLFASAISRKQADALGLAYGLAVSYCAVVVPLSLRYAIGATMSSASGHSPISGMNPFTAQFSVQGSTPILGVSMPDWIIAIAVCLLLSRMIILAAGAALSEYRSKETISFRINLLLHIFALAWAAPQFFGGSVGSAVNPDALGRNVSWMAIVLVALLPRFVTFGWDANRRNEPDGTFSIKNAFLGTPSGGYAYGLMIVIVLFGGTTIGRFGSGSSSYVVVRTLSSTSVTEDLLGFVRYGVWMCCFYVFATALGRLMSSMIFNIRSARGLFITLLGVACAIPEFIVDAVRSRSDEVANFLHPFTLLAPITELNRKFPSELMMVHGLALILLAILFERLTANNLAKVHRQFGMAVA